MQRIGHADTHTHAFCTRMVVLSTVASIRWRQVFRVMVVPSTVASSRWRQVFRVIQILDEVLELESKKLIALSRSSLFVAPAFASCLSTYVYRG
jgi:hypothetical protein